VAQAGKLEIFQRLVAMCSDRISAIGDKIEAVCDFELTAKVRHFTCKPFVLTYCNLGRCVPREK
jgi:hypothetical protein